MVSTDRGLQAPALDRGRRLLLIGLTVWVLLQLSRLVAIQLIGSVADGVDDPAWLYPAILDVVCAVAAPFLALALWKWRGLAVWTLTVVYLTVSIVDHVGFFVIYAQVGSPVAFEGMMPTDQSWVVPAIQTVIDAVFLFLVMRRTDVFFTLARPAASATPPSAG